MLVFCQKFTKRNWIKLVFSIYHAENKLYPIPFCKFLTKDQPYNKYKDLKGRTKSGIFLKNKAYKIAANPKYDFQRALASMVWKLFDKRSKKVLGPGVDNRQLADELHKPIIKNFKRRKVYSSFKDNIWGVDLADMSLISKFNKGIKYLLCVIDMFSRYAWVVGLKDKKGSSIVNGFQSISK